MGLTSSKLDCAALADALQQLFGSSYLTTKAVSEAHTYHRGVLSPGGGKLSILTLVLSSLPCTLPRLVNAKGDPGYGEGLPKHDCLL